MTYQIKRTDGKRLAEVVENTIDQKTTNLTLIGKNFVSYGQYLNENFVKILENFADTKQPNRPLSGQLWFDTRVNRLKVYDGAIFKNIGGAIVSPFRPWNLVSGDLWINNETNQFSGYDGSELSLIGPIYTAQQGLSGFLTETILDSNNLPRVIVKVWCGETLLGIISNERVTFTPRDAISDFQGVIYPGFNQSTLEDFTFRATVTASTGLLRKEGPNPFFPSEILSAELRPASVFMVTESNTGTIGTVKLTNDIPLVLGSGANGTDESKKVTFRELDTEFNIDVGSLDFGIFSKSIGSIDEALVFSGDTVRIFSGESLTDFAISGSIGALHAYVGDYVEQENSDYININKNQYYQFNNDETGSGVTDIYAGLNIDRGSLPDAVLRWNETTRRWELSNDSSFYYNILVETDFARAALTSDWLDVIDKPIESEIWKTNLYGIYHDGNIVGVQNDVPMVGLDTPGVVKSLASYESPIMLGSSTVINVSAGGMFSKTITQPTTFTLTNVPTGTISFVLEIINGASNPIQWWNNIKWPNGEEPFFTTGKDLVSFYTTDSGNTWVGFVIGKDFKRCRRYHWVSFLSGVELVNEGSSIVTDSGRNVYTVGSATTNVSEIITIDANLVAETSFLNSTTPNLTNAAITTLTNNTYPIKDISTLPLDYWFARFNSEYDEINAIVKTDLARNIYISSLIKSNEDTEDDVHYMSLAKITQFGQVLWQRVINNAESGNYISVTPAGVIYSCVTIQDEEGTYGLVSRYTTAGAPVWERRIDNFTLRTIKIDTSENSYVLGNSGLQLVLLKFNNLGSLEWSINLGNYNPQDLHIRGTEVFAVGKSTTSSTIFNLSNVGQITWARGINTIVKSITSTGSFIYVSGDQNNRIFIARLNTTGAIDWQTALGSSTETFLAKDLAIDPVSGELILVGDSFVNEDTPSKVIIASYTPDGVLQWQRFGYMLDTNIVNTLFVDDEETMFIGANCLVGSYDNVIAKIPVDASLTGTYDLFNYVEANLITSTPSVTSTSISITPTSITTTVSPITVFTVPFTLLLTVVPVYEQLGYWINLSGSTGNNSGSGTAVDTDGFIYTCGTVGLNNNDMLVQKYNSQGQILWSTSLSGTGIETATGIVISADNFIYVSGTTTSTGAGSTDGYLVKLTTNGTLVWQRALGSTGADRFDSVAVDSSGNVIVTGIGRFGNNDDFIVAKYNSLGTIQWQRRIGASNRSEFGYAVATDSAGNVYATGEANPGGSRGIDMYLVKYNASGVLQWQRSLGTNSDDIGRGIAVDSSNNLYIAGQSGSSGFIAKYSDAGTLLWQRSVSGATVRLNAVHISGNNVYITGTVNSTIILIIKADINGSLIWQRTINGTGIESGTDIVTDQFGDVFVVGSTTSTTSGRNNLLLAKIPADGSQTSVQGNFTYTISTYTWATSSLTTATISNAEAASTLTGTTPTSTIPSSTVPLTNDFIFFVAPAQQWLTTISSSLEERGYSVTNDIQSNTIVCSTYRISSSRTLILVTKYDPTGLVLWQRTIGGNSGITIPNSVVTDTDLNIIICGQTTSAGSGSNDIYLLKLSPTGTTIYQRAFGLSGSDIGSSIAIGTDNNYYIAGTTSGQSNTAVLVMKISPAGNIIWQKSYEAPGSASGTGITAAIDNTIYITGSYSPPGSGSDILIMKLTNNGLPVWEKMLRSERGDFGRGVTIDNFGNLILCGEVGKLNSTISDAPIIAKFSLEGGSVWKRVLTETNADQAYSITSDSLGNVYVCGESRRSGSINDSIVACYDINGILQWQRRIRAPGTSLARSIFADASGNVILTGEVKLGKTIDIYTMKIPADGSLLGSYGGFAYVQSNLLDRVPDLISSNRETYLVKYNNSGDVLWQRTLDYTEADQGVSVNIGLDDSVYVLSESRDIRDQIVIGKFSPRGVMEWDIAITTNNSRPNVNLLTDIGTDISGNVYLARTVFNVDRNADKPYITKLDPTGNYTSQIKLDDNTSNSDLIGGVATTSNGTLLLVGSKISGSKYIAYMVKMNEQLGSIWQRTISDTFNVYGKDAVFDESDGSAYVLVSGRTSSSERIVLYKFDVNGNALWSRSITGVLADSPAKVYINRKKQVFVQASRPDGSSLMIRLNTSGTVLWSSTLDKSIVNPKGRTIHADRYGNIYIAGSCRVPGNDLYQDGLAAKLPSAGVKDSSVTYGVKTVTLSNIGVTSTFTTSPTGVIAFDTFTVFVSQTPPSQSEMIILPGQLRIRNNPLTIETFEI
jgi:uncharacterized delta-60 repeat protein